MIKILLDNHVFLYNKMFLFCFVLYIYKYITVNNSYIINLYRQKLNAYIYNTLQKNC